MAELASLISQHFVKAVESSSIRLEPFPHLVVDGILPSGVFQRLSDDLPSFSDLGGVSEARALGMAAYDRRASLPVEEFPSPGSTSVWDDTDKGLRSDEVERVLVDSFSPWIDSKAWQALAEPLRRQVRLHCDLAGFKMDPHTDAAPIFITSIIYVRSGVPDLSLNTVLYEPLNPEARLRNLDGKDYAHEDPSDHRRVGSAVFHPNRMFSFLSTASSLHGMGPVSDQAAPRYVITLRLKYSVQSV